MSRKYQTYQWIWTVCLLSFLVVGSASGQDNEQKQNGGTAQSRNQESDKRPSAVKRPPNNRDSGENSQETSKVIPQQVVAIVTLKNGKQHQAAKMETQRNGNLILTLLDGSNLTIAKPDVSKVEPVEPAATKDSSPAANSRRIQNPANSTGGLPGKPGSQSKESSTGNRNSPAGRNPNLAGGANQTLDRETASSLAITATTPAEITSLAAGSERQATLFGRNLSKITQARLTQRGQTVSGVHIDLGPVAAVGAATPNGKSIKEYRPLTIRVDSKITATGTYSLEVETGGAWVAAPLKLHAAAANATLQVGRSTRGSREIAGIPSAANSNSGNGNARLRAIPATQFDSLKANVATRSKYIPVNDGSSLSAIELPIDAVAGLLQELPTAKVVSYRPAGTKAAYGGLLQLNGTQLGSENVNVRFNNNLLTVIQRSNDQLTVALPDGGPQPVTAKLEISNGHLANNSWQTIHAQYELMPEAQLQPRVVVDAIDGAPLSSEGLPYDRTSYQVLFTFHEVPGDYLEKFDMDLPYIDTATVTSTTNFSFNSFSVVVEGVEMPSTVPMNSWFTTMRQGNDQTRKSFTGVKATIPKKTRPVHVVSETQALSAVLNFQLTDSWGLIEGQTLGSNGAVTVGQLQIGNDLAFRITSGPTGAAATWVSSMVQLNNGWSLVEMEWDETNVTPPGAPQAASVGKGGGMFDRGQKYVGWKTLPTFGSADYSAGDSPMVRFDPFVIDSAGKVWHNPAPYNQPSNRFVRPLRVELWATSHADNTNHVIARLKSIKLRGPEGGNWQDAFGDSTAYQNGQWFVDSDKPIQLFSATNGPNH